MRTSAAAVIAVALVAWSAAAGAQPPDGPPGHNRTTTTTTTSTTTTSSPTTTTTTLGTTTTLTTTTTTSSTTTTTTSPSGGGSGGETSNGTGTVNLKRYPPLLTTLSSVGRWSVPATLGTAKAVHATLLTNGKILVVEGSALDSAQFAAGSFKAYLLDPATWTVTPLPQTPVDLVCGLHVIGADGRVLLFGGTSRFPTSTQQWGGEDAIYSFDPATNTFATAGHMLTGRWYPEAVTTGSGDVAITGGYDANGDLASVQELYHPATQTSSVLSTATIGLYTHQILLADGRFFFTGVDYNGGSVAPAKWTPSTGAIQLVPGLGQANVRAQAASVLTYPAQNQNVVVIGGGQGLTTTTTTSIYRTSLGVASPQYTLVGNLPAGKTHVLATNLPDGTVLETGGASGFASANEVGETSVFNPANNSLTRMAAPMVGRSYHSEILLLPDGRVVTLGSNAEGVPWEYRIEVFEPPYLFKGTRPAITASPTAVTYGGTYTASATVSGTTMKAFLLIRPESYTHSTDSDARSVDVPFTVTATGDYSLAIPSNRNVLPPGPYMLFALDSQGRPSVARWVSVG